MPEPSAGRAFERERRLSPQVVQRRLQQHQDLGDRIERELLQLAGELSRSWATAAARPAATVLSVCAKSYDMA